MNPAPPMPMPRSHLFVPGDRSERFDGALASEADAAVQPGGRMVDRPVIERAHRLVQAAR